MPDAPATISDSRPHPRLSTPELVALVALLAALNALAIDIMLPALPDIGAAFGLIVDNDRQLVIILYVIAFGLAQLAYGPLADSYGRRIVLIWALALFVVGAFLCVVAPSFELFLAARALQGVGAAATSVISRAVVRDLTSGRRMAQIMSMAMTLFMIVPIVAPGVGQLILFVAPWRWIFGALVIYSLTILLWVWLRLPETLAPENRAPFRLGPILENGRFILRQRTTVGYMIATVFMVGCLFGYVTSSEQIYVEVFDLGPAFPLAFASVAIVMSLGTFLNSRIVMRYGMRRISHTMIFAFTAIAALHALLLALGVHSIWAFLALLAINLSMFGMIGGNFNALAMEPVGRVAGSAASIYGAVTATFGAAIGGVIARLYDGTALPFALGLLVMGLAAIATIWITERGRLFVEPPRAS